MTATARAGIMTRRSMRGLPHSRKEKSMFPEFHSAAMLDFSRPDAEAGMRHAIERARSNFGTPYPLLIGGQRITTNEAFQSREPANPSECVGNFSKATIQHGNGA